MIVQEIDATSTLDIRQRLLRPQLRPEDCFYAGDRDSSTTHFGAFLDDKQVGIVSLYQRGSEKIDRPNGYQIRAMATLEEARGMGAGRALLQAAENHAFADGAGYIWANARIVAKGFYEKAGYQIGEDEFNIEGVGLHVLIWKYPD